MPYNLTMLKLSDFFHLSQLDTAVAALVSDQPGLIVVTGLDPRPIVAPVVADQFLPSGRVTFFRMLVQAALDHVPTSRAVVVSETPDAVRVPRHMRRRISVVRVHSSQEYAAQISAAVASSPGLLVIDRLCEATAQAALAAAQAGVPVITQRNSGLRGTAMVRELRDFGVGNADAVPLWVVSVRRLPMLCTHCRVEREPTLGQRARLAALFGDESTIAGVRSFDASLCHACEGSGRQGDVALFDICRIHGDPDDPASCAYVLRLEEYALGLAQHGMLTLDDVFNLDTDDTRRMFRMFEAGEQALTDANAGMERKLVELSAANEVLRQRTAALMSLQDIGQALITSTSLGDLVGRVCRHARELCGADRALLYLLAEDGGAELFAASGWEDATVGERVEREHLIAAKPAPFSLWPPGVPWRHPDLDGGDLRAGLRVPLIAEGQQVGAMIVHSTLKSRFAPGEVALLQTFASQAALSIERARLIEQLREKIAQLEAAQAALVRQERLEREMELARQVQQDILPHVFPQVPGFSFGACNRPARQVGGDFYDVFVLDDNHVGIVIADVSDKGMPAALYMALTRSLLLAEARRERSPRAVLLNVNRLLREVGDPHMFVTVFYGVIALRERSLIFARAGHDYPLLFRDGTIQQLEGTGVVLGMLDVDQLRLSEEDVRLAPGDRLVLYTDGLTDVLNEAGKRLELPQLTQLLQKHVHRNAGDLCSCVFDDLAAYQGQTEQYDDMTILVVAVE